MTATQLTSLLKRGTRCLMRVTYTDKAFQGLKWVFTSAPILQHPDPEKPFIVEVDASDTGVGAIVSQCFGDEQKMYPVVFFSRNQELLMVKLALKKWRHWLKGSKFRFTVLTDHKNLEYLYGVKRLNPKQARWALFFTRFDFTMAYRPVAQNTKADELSQTSEHESILPSTCWVNAICWEFNKEITKSLPYHVSDKCPTKLTHVRCRLISWAHATPASRHPGMRRTWELIGINTGGLLDA